MMLQGERLSCTINIGRNWQPMINFVTISGQALSLGDGDNVGYNSSPCQSEFACNLLIRSARCSTSINRVRDVLYAAAQSMRQNKYSVGISVVNGVTVHYGYPRRTDVPCGCCVVRLH